MSKDWQIEIDAIPPTSEAGSPMPESVLVAPIGSANSESLVLAGKRIAEACAAPPIGALAAFPNNGWQGCAFKDLTPINP